MSAAETGLDRQVDRLLSLGYAELAGLSDDGFRQLCEPLRAAVPAETTAETTAGTTAGDDGALPFLLVVPASTVPTVAAVQRWSVGGRSGWTDMEDELAGYRPIEEVRVPAAPAYLLIDVRTGRDTLGVTPAEALPRIAAAGRTPLTIDEGVALVTQRPDVFGTHNAFQALGSRAPNKRIPSFWMSKGAPRLGWCWLNNPHSWLGAASASARVGPPA